MPAPSQKDREPMPEERIEEQEPEAPPMPRMTRRAAPPRALPPAPLGYDEDDAPRAKRGGMLSGGLGQIIVTLIIALVVTIGWSMFQGYVGKSQYVADVTRLESDLVVLREADKGINTRMDTLTSTANSARTVADAARASITELQAKDTALTGQLTAMVADVGKRATSEQVAVLLDKAMIGYAKGADMTALQATVAALTADLAVAKAEIQTLKTTIGTGTGTSGNGTATNAVKVQTATLGGLPMQLSGIPTGSYASQVVRLTVTNTSAKYARNIQMTMTVTSNAQLPAWATGFPQVVGFQPSWSFVNGAGNVMVFVGGWQSMSTFELSPGQTKTLYPELRLQSSAAGAWNTQTFLFAADCTVDYYELQ